MNYRSLLFVPGSRPDRFDKALAAGASAVIIDLEDAVAPSDKDAARDAVSAWLAVRPAAALGCPVMLRINSADTPWFDSDLALCSAGGLAAMMLPKAERPETVATLRDAGAPSVLPLIESAAGLAAAGSIAAAPGVACLVFGSIDFQVDLGLRDAEEDDLLMFRMQLVMASRLAGIAAPVDGVSTAIDDETRLHDDVLRARRLGFAGKLCIHPKQVAGVNRWFAPSDAECAWARRVLDAAAASGSAAVAVDGKMVDKPVLLRAEAVLKDAGSGGK